jgi:hypothetical protein
VLHFLIPQRRNILDLNLAINQRAFNFIAQDNMRRVADFVGIDADKARFDALVPGDEVFALKAGCSPKLAYRRQQALQEGVAASKLHFKKQALRFVDRRGAGQGNRLIEPGRGRFCS